MLKIESYKKGIVLSTIFNIFNKGLVFTNGIVVAYFFGTSHGTDIFFFTYNSLIIISAFFMNTNSTVIIPESMRIRALDGNDKAMSFLNFFVLAYGALMATGVLIFLLDPVTFFSHVSNFSNASLITNKDLLYLSLPLFGMACLVTLFIDILTSYKFFTISMVVGIINGITTMLIILCLHRTIGIQSAFIGSLSSYIINTALLVYILKKKLKWTFNFSYASISPRIWQNLGFAQLGNLASSVSLYTPMYILSGFNAGVVTALTFAQQISALPNALITTQFSAVAGIKLNELFAVSNTSEINRIFTQTANLLHFIMIPLSCLIFVYSPQIVQVFSSIASLNIQVATFTTTFLKYLGLLLPFYVSNTLISRMFMGSHKIKESFWYQLIFNLIQIAALYLAIKRFGIIGYPVTLVVIYLSSTLSYYFIEKRYFKLINYTEILKNFLIFTVVNVTIAGFVYYFILATGITDKFLVLIIGSLLQFTLLLLANSILKTNELISDLLFSLLVRVKGKTNG